MTHDPLNRRDFVGGTAVATAAGLVTGGLGIAEASKTKKNAPPSSRSILNFNENKE